MISDLLRYCVSNFKVIADGACRLAGGWIVGHLTKYQETGIKTVALSDAHGNTQD